MPPAPADIAAADPRGRGHDVIVAWTRVFACAFALLVVAALGCRPRWSADGKRLTYAALDGKRHLVAELDLGTGRSTKLFDIGPNDGALDMVRDPDQARWVVVWADSVDDAVVNVRTRDDAGEESEPHAIRTGGRNITTMLTEPVVADGYVFLTASTILRVNLETGATKKLDRRGMLAFPVKGGVGYLSTNKQDWEIGRLDPKTLALQPQITRPDGCAWKIMGAPRFDPTGERCAVVAAQGERRAGLDALSWALLVFDGAELLTTVELEGPRSMGPIAWLDAVTVGATVMHPGDKEDRFALLEANISGSFQRETHLLSAPIQQKLLNDGGVIYQLKQPLLLQPSPSPDGKTVAFTTAKMPELPGERGGLLLLRRDRKNRVERVPFAFSDK